MYIYICIPIEPFPDIATYLHSKKSLPTISAEDMSLIIALQELLQHTFEHPALLIEAVTHPSCGSKAYSYQVLEFLGDAVLDFIVTVCICYISA